MEIGGFLPLELNKNSFYHNGTFFNSGRNALRAILINNKFTRAYISYFTCDAITQVLNEEKVLFEFYQLNSDLLPNFDFTSIKEDELFVINNYWGLLDSKLNHLLPRIKNCLVDNAQGFFYKPNSKAFVIYSPRKFFGIPDGGISNFVYEEYNQLETQKVSNNVEHLVERIETGSNNAYEFYLKNEECLSKWPIKKMSNFTRLILSSVNYDQVIKKRRENYQFLEAEFQNSNKLKVSLDKDAVPLYYPLYIENGEELRGYLNSIGIFNPLLWPNVLEWTIDNQFEHQLAKNTVNLPIDQRYDTSVMALISKKINNYFEYK